MEANPICESCGRETVRRQTNGLLVHNDSGLHRCDGKVGRKFGRTAQVAFYEGAPTCDCWVCEVPPLKQDATDRAYEVGDRVFAHWHFNQWLRPQAVGKCERFDCSGTAMWEIARLPGAIMDRYAVLRVRDDGTTTDGPFWSIGETDMVPA